MKNNRHLVNIDNGRLVTPVTAASLSPQSNNNSAAVSNIHNKQEELGQQPVHIN